MAATLAARDRRFGQLMAAPGLAALLLVIVFPILFTLYTSAFDFTLINPRHDTFVGLDHYADVVHKRNEEHGWKSGIDFVPHDAKIREWGSGRTRVETMRDFHLSPQLCTNATKMDGINAARQTLARCVFHNRCEEVGISALEQYRREWDDEKKTFRASEVHDWTSHLADAFRYLALSWRYVPEPVVEKPSTPPPGKIKPPPPIEPNGRRMRI